MSSKTKILKIKRDANFEEIVESMRFKNAIQNPMLLTRNALHYWLSTKARILGHSVSGCSNSIECHRCGASLEFSTEDLTARGTLAVSIQKEIPCISELP